MVSNHNSRTKDFENVLEKKHLKNKLSTLELTKESFFICKTRTKVLCYGFGKRK